RPRHRNSPEFQELRAEMLQALHVAEGGGPGNKSHSAKTTVAMSDRPSAPAQARNPALQAPARPSPSLDADVIIIGGGPAGSPLGASLAKAGIDHLILDKSVHPRRHVGESLVCSTTRLFEEIDFLPVLEREGFVRKYGANWVHWADSQQCSLRFREIPEL